MRIHISSLLVLTFFIAGAANAQGLSGDWGNNCGGHLSFREEGQRVSFDCDNPAFHHHFVGEFERNDRRIVKGSITRRELSNNCELGPIPASIFVINDRQVKYSQGNWGPGCDLTVPVGGGDQVWTR